MPVKRALRSSPRLLNDNHIGTADYPDRIGKVFYVLGQGMRQCLICDGVFTGQAAAEHAGTAWCLSCSAGRNPNTGSWFGRWSPIRLSVNTLR